MVSSKEDPVPRREPKNEWVGSYIAVIAIVVPGLNVSGFMPDWNVLPFSVWLSIAATGTAVGFAIYTKRSTLGLFAGAIIGAGAMMGIYRYVDLRFALTGSKNFMNLEILLGCALGALPGLLLYLFFVRRQE